MNPSRHIPLPVTFEECLERDWREVDIILVSGDAYVDHPSFGIAIIGRVLEKEGYRVAILPQPRFDALDDFRRFGRPRLFYGISGGNLDSIVANYTGNGKVREFDAYSPSGSPWRAHPPSRSNRYRPDRAVLIYANLARQAYPGVHVILGGIEASLRRFVHFDYKQNRLRGSHLTDAKADLLVYGMGETAILEISRRLQNGHELSGIAGTCTRMSDEQFASLQRHVEADKLQMIKLPSWQAINDKNSCFLAAEKHIDRHSRAYSQALLAQRQQAAWLVQYPASPPLQNPVLDALYHLPFSRKPHPSTPDIPAYEMIKNSVTIVRGCPGNCSFCAISRHQGPATISRSLPSIVQEIEDIVNSGQFDGTISDLGGPTANMFGTHCSIGSCAKHDCLYPTVCKNLVINEAAFTSLLHQVLEIPGVKHAFISSGLRTGLLQHTPKLFEQILLKHTPGVLKIAPEHTETDVLQLMHKEPHSSLVEFVTLFNSICKRLRIKRELSPYIISAHPGSTELHARKMAERCRQLDLKIRKFQDFTPTPGTLSTAMYVTGLSASNGKPIPVAHSQAQRAGQRKLIEAAFFKPEKERKRLDNSNRKTSRAKRTQKNRQNRKKP